jgi:hypothetical protein
MHLDVPNHLSNVWPFTAMDNLDEMNIRVGARFYSHGLGLETCDVPWSHRMVHCNQLGMLPSGR